MCRTTKRLLNLLLCLFALGLYGCANADLQFPPLVNGEDTARFKFHDLLMAPAGQQAVTLNYGSFNLRSFSTRDLARIASPLIDRIMDSGFISSVNVEDSGNSTKRIQEANAVFFLISIHPDVLVAVPVRPDDINKGQGNIQNTVLSYIKKLNALSISNLVSKGDCTSVEYASSSESCKLMGRRQPINNQLIVSRVILDRKDAYLVSENMDTPVALQDHFVVGGLKFELRPVEGLSGYLEVRVIH